MNMARKTIIVNCRSYTVSETGTDSAPYTLTGARGAEYTMVRNIPNPKVLRPFNFNSRNGSTPFDGISFTDVDGLLAVVDVDNYRRVV